jgi:hypothetical protein
MNDDISVDISAEQQSFSAAISPSGLDMSAITAAQQSVELPPSILITPTNIQVDADTVADISKVAVDLDVKFDAEAAIKSLNSRVQDLSDSVGDAVNSMNTKWIPDPKAAQRFDERPTTQTSNLIFDSRSNEFTNYPRWG